MPIRKSAPFRWTPKGCSDTQDSTEEFPGAMSALTNLVPDPKTDNLWVPRPAAQLLTSFAGFTTPGFISGQFVVGNYVYGMIATGRTAGHDEPFAFNLSTSTFTTIAGVVAGNVPISPATSGAWTPPAFVVVGTKLVVTHPGFNGINGYVGWLDISTPASPVWSSGNTAITALPSPPVSVAQFNGRAYYICNPPNGQPSVLASDSLDATTRTNPTYVLTFDDNVPLTAAFGMPLSNQLGGIIQSLMVFKGGSNVYQITGDFATPTNPITKNALNVATGTLSPDAICATPKGIAFFAPDGLRFIDFNARMSDPIGIGGKGIALPFSQALVPSRTTAACNGTTIRVTVQNGAALAQPFQEWVYDMTRDVWHGPHTFPYTSIDDYGQSYILVPQGIVAQLWQSDISPNTISTYTENGVPLTFNYQTALFPDQGTMSRYSISETLLYMGFGAGTTNYTVSVYDQDSVLLNYAFIGGSGNASLWGVMIWGQDDWGGAAGKALNQHKVPWTKPIVFDRCSVSVSGTSAAGVVIGDLYGRWTPLGYAPLN